MGPEGHGDARVAQLGALLAAFERAKLLSESDDSAQQVQEDEQWIAHWWYLLWPFLSARVFPVGADQRTGAASSTDVVHLVDSQTGDESSQAQHLRDQEQLQAHTGRQQEQARKAREAISDEERPGET